MFILLKRIITISLFTRTQPPRVNPIHRIIPHIREPVLPISNRVFRNKPRVCRRVVSKAVVTQPRNRVIGLTGVARLQSVSFANMRTSAALFHKNASSTYHKYACGAFLFMPRICSTYLQKRPFQELFFLYGFLFMADCCILFTTTLQKQNAAPRFPLVSFCRCCFLPAVFFRFRSKNRACFIQASKRIPLQSLSVDENVLCL